ncbi:L-arginine-binding protein [Salsuginibacillus halophilus]|uniref:L-arginine-binding protein n=1 Tax=Salsuginibacillus halophilus TaxID=517424 RepID=A0A2P8HQQ1_9BACI|nr:transporter substrate-binding domain-containing protein [Salsuginibacillus halophilus]PSL48548.1 L-arginine-binding protein [Salsuginibacillus halophilus]
MKKSALFGMGILAAGMVTACGNGGDGEDEQETLTMGTSADYPPFEYIETGESDEIVGFDVDLAEAITDELGYDLEIQDMEFGGLIPALNSNRVDFVMAGMRPTEERRENVDFSDIYFESNHTIVTKEEFGIEEAEDLEGGTLGVQLGSIQEGQAEELGEEVPDLEVETRDRIPELVQEIINDRFDAAIIADTVAYEYIEREDGLKGFDLPNQAEEDGNAIAFPQDSELTEEFNEVLDDMKESGELDDLIIKWFDEMEIDEDDVSDEGGEGYDGEDEDDADDEEADE